MEDGKGREGERRGGSAWTSTHAERMGQDQRAEIQSVNGFWGRGPMWMMGVRVTLGGKVARMDVMIGVTRWDLGFPFHHPLSAY